MDIKKCDVCGNLHEVNYEKCIRIEMIKSNSFKVIHDFCSKECYELFNKRMNPKEPSVIEQWDPTGIKRQLLR